MVKKSFVLKHYFDNIRVVRVTYFLCHIGLFVNCILFKQMVKLSMLQKNLWIEIASFNKNMHMMMKFNKYIPSL
jgi:hypothetical protein